MNIRNDAESVIKFPKFDALKSKSPIHYYVGTLEYEHDLIQDRVLKVAVLINSKINLLQYSEDEVMDMLEFIICEDGVFSWLNNYEDFTWEVKVNFSVQSQQELETLKMMHHYHIRADKLSV